MAGNNSIAFKNLRAEMARKKVTITEIANELGIARETLGSKFSRKRPINLDEALHITRTFFPECDVYYLFEELIPSDTKGA